MKIFGGDEQRKALEDVIQISRNVKPIYWVWLTIRDDAVHRVFFGPMVQTAETVWLLASEGV